MPLQILLNGAKGRMGQAIAKVAPEFDVAIYAAVDQGDDATQFIAGADMVVDFSFHSITPAIAALAAKNGKPIVIGTTGHTPEERAAIIAFSKEIPMIYAGNYSVGVNLLYYLVEQAAKTLGPDFNPEVMEMHHNQKKDAPSGTAEHIVEVLREARGISKDHVLNGRSGMIGARPQDEIGVHALRGGDVVGEHTVFFIGQGERIELTHRATDRAILARGALRAANWLKDRQAPGLYEMKDVLGLGA
jgi:4-hydroxy-tetrahydrodipicolinate reductase